MQYNQLPEAGAELNVEQKPYHTMKRAAPEFNFEICYASTRLNSAIVLKALKPHIRFSRLDKKSINVNTSDASFNNLPNGGSLLDWIMSKCIGKIPDLETPNICTIFSCNQNELKIKSRESQKVMRLLGKKLLIFFGIVLRKISCKENFKNT